MFNRRRFLTLSLAAAAFGAGPRSGRAALEPGQAEAVAKAERYLNGIRTLHARFVQVSSNGAYAEGEVYVRRPGRMRFEYDPPHPVLMIADGTSLLYYDKELKQATFIPLGETPLWFLIRKHVELSDNIEVTGVDQAAGVTRITVRQKDAGAAGGTVTLVFSDPPFALRKWAVADAQGIITEVTLLNPEYGRKVSDKVFDYSDLDVYGFRSRGDGR